MTASLHSVSDPWFAHHSLIVIPFDCVWLSYWQRCSINHKQELFGCAGSLLLNMLTVVKHVQRIGKKWLLLLSCLYWEVFVKFYNRGGGILRSVEKIPVCLIPDKNKVLNLKIYLHLWLLWLLALPWLPLLPRSPVCFCDGHVNVPEVLHLADISFCLLNLVAMLFIFHILLPPNCI